MTTFDLGQVIATPAALQAARIAGQTTLVFLLRHARGDWGDVNEADWQENGRCLREGCRLFSAYTTAKGQRLWVITEADRSVTTILLPDDY